jgi:hypothetical protein
LNGVEGAHSLVIAVNRRHLSISSAACALIWCASSAAQEGARVDLYSGPLVTSGRVIGMGGAFLAIAEGADAQLINPVAYTMRAPHTINDWFDWDVALSLFNVGAEDDTDLDQSGRSAFEDAELVQLGFNLKFGRHGFGMLGVLQNYTISRNLEDDEEELVYGQSVISIGYAYAETAWSWGVALVGGSARIKEPNAPEPIARLSGAGVMVGAVFHPPDSQWRYGITARTQSLGKDFEGDQSARNTLIPQSIVLPGSIAIGAARMFGQRPATATGSFGEGPPQPIPHGRYLLVASDLVMTGPTDNAVTPQAFLDADPMPTDIPIALSLRLGAEAEVLPDLLRVRAGTYYEPDRLDPWAGRWHITSGVDLAIDVWTRWRLGAVIDAADGWLNFGVGLGFWR